MNKLSPVCMETLDTLEPYHYFPSQRAFKSSSHLLALELWHYEHKHLSVLVSLGLEGMGTKPPAMDLLDTFP